MMKNTIAIMTMLFSFMLLTSCDKETIIPENKIPVEIKNYVSTHFPSCSILSAIKEKNEPDEMYEIKLSCGFKLEFNKNKEIIDIDGTTKIPDSVVPEKILTYVATNYPNNNIVGWELERSNQKVDLDNKVAIIFNMQGDFIKVDD